MLVAVASGVAIMLRTQPGLVEPGTPEPAATPELG